MTAKPPKSTGKFNIAKGAVVCSTAQLMGDITIGTQTVIHPSAKILALGGPIIIGESNLIQEGATIINKKLDGDMDAPPMVIGNGNVFEIHSYCASKKVGDSNTLEAKSHIGAKVTLTQQCVIGAGCTINSEETLPENTVIYGSKCTRYVKSIPSQTSNQQHLEYLLKLLPNFHHLIKSN